MGGWVGQKVGLDGLENRKISFSCRKLPHDSSAVYPQFNPMHSAATVA